MTASDVIPYLVAAHIAVALAKVSLPFSEKILTRRLSEFCKVLLFLIEVGCGLAVAVLTIRNFRACPGLAVTAISFAVAAAAASLLAEAIKTTVAMCVQCHPRYKPEVGPSFAVFYFFFALITLAPALAAAVRWWVRYSPFACPASFAADSIILICTSVAGLVEAAFRIKHVNLKHLYEPQDAVSTPFPVEDIGTNGEHVDGDVLPPRECLIYLEIIWYNTWVFGSPLLAFALGLWAVLDTKRFVLVNGLIVAVPSILSMAMTPVPD